LASRLIETLSFDEKAGLYVFDVTTNGSRLIETLSFDEKAGLHVFDVTTNGKNKAVVPILA
jgi:hypothetical protein